MGTSDDARRRLMNAGTAKDLYASGQSNDLHGQQTLVAETLRQFWDAGMDRATLITTLISGVCFFADNLGIPREKLIQAFREAHAPKDAELIIRPGGA